jgi:hypothetical protein
MKKHLPLLLVLLFLSGYGYSQETELHAFELDHQGVYPEKNFLDNPLFIDYNISLQSAPQNEPTVRISRANPNIVVAAWRDFREGYIEPNVVRRIGYSYSHDGGHTWSESQLLPDPLPNHLSQSDPVLTSDAAGHFYLSSTSRQPVTNYNRDMLMYKSTDDGMSFQLHAIAVPGSGQQGEDKEWIFCDPVSTNPTYDQIMIAWRSFGPTPKIMFRKSDVGGTIWSETVEVSDNYAGQGANLATGTNGSIYVVWWDNGLRFDRSTNAGESFGIDTYISTYSSQSNTSFPFICVDYSNKPSRGNVYTVWADRRNGTDDIWFQRSSDHGDSWMISPIMVNDVELNHQYWPSIQCDDNGRLAVIYFDEREGPSNMNAYLAYSDDEGNTWTNTRLSNMSFHGITPNSNVRFGDYIDIDAYDGKIVPVWTDDRLGSYNQEIYTAIVDIPQAVNEYKSVNDAFTLYQNYPNPFSGRTTIQFELKDKMHLKAEIYNMAGQLVSIVADADFEQGHKQIVWDATGLNKGIYHLKMMAGNSVSYLKLIHR